MGVLRDIGMWLWRLAPANPIMVRVVTAGGRRQRHFAAQVIYLGVLFIVMWVGQSMYSSDESLAALAKKSSQVFMLVSMVQLLLMCFIAPVFTAGAITQEKDSNTFNILLTTPLSDAQIVLGSLLSRLFFVWVLLLSGLPIFCITMIFGGVTTAEIFESFALAGCTALFTGSLAIAISVLKVGTQRTIFSFFLGIAIYLLGIGALSQWSATWLPTTEAQPGAGLETRISWLAPVHPFLALLVVTGKTPAPDPSAVRHYGWPWSWLIAQPQYGYIVLTTLASAATIFVSLLSVRRSANKSDGGWIERIVAFFKREPAGDRQRKPRRVWSNPIAWREAATRGSAAGRSGLRWAFSGAGVLAGVLLLIAYEKGWSGLKTEDVRYALTALIWIELAIILLVVTNTSAATLTRERDSGTMDLLLATPMTSKYIIAGMLRGLVSFVIPLISVPTLTILIFVVADLFRPAASPKITTPESVILTPILIIAISAAAAMIGLYRSLNSRKTIQAVMTSTAIVIIAAGGFYGCVMGIAQGGPQVAAVFTPLSPFHAMQTLVDFQQGCSLSLLPAGSAEFTQIRVLRSITSVISAGAYVLFVVTMYNAMVRGFDMTVRRQSV